MKWTLFAGLNSVTFEGSVSTPASSVFDAYADKVEIVWHYDGATEAWTRYVPGISDPMVSTLTTLLPGKIYSVKVKAGTEPFELTYSAGINKWLLLVGGLVGLGVILVAAKE